MSDALASAGGHLVQLMWKFIPDSSKSRTFPGAHWYDFNTPEYQVFHEVRAKKWEATRGVGHSFGANRNERPQDIVTTTELVRLLVDVVSQNGNLLIGIGPNENGCIPDQQAAPLRGLGAWMTSNGNAIYGSRPWQTAETTTSEGTDVRLWQKSGDVYAALIDLPGARTFTLHGIDAGSVDEVHVVGSGADVDVGERDGLLEITMPERVPVEPAYVLRLG